MRGPSGRTGCRVSSLWSPTPRDNRDFRLLLWGNGANYGPVSVPSADTFTGAMATETPNCTLACVAPSAEQVCRVSSALGYLLREIIATSGSYYGVSGANTGQLAYLRRHFHRKRWPETPKVHFWHAWPIGPNKSAKFRRSGSPTPRD
ncbi:hypothetical protein DPMN_092436 [Dreissena polymorpha]|uniref:Uncharacterized protein n=1 Tax=Dreissena polymorpha TaxID=45954 RepID=A0A9D4L3X5_DREPO|nr:hypothetical protein DPMN_092436 [Dreissena polymorpha]